MDADRLLNVAKALRESPNPDKFDMGSYVHPCGTPSCAFGHYALRSDLQSEFTAHAAPNFWQGVDIVGGKLDISYADERVLDHFEITENQADQLFGDPGLAKDRVMAEEIPESAFLSLNARTANEAADWIERFVAKHSEVTQS